MRLWAKLKMPVLVTVVLLLASYVVFLEVQANGDSDDLIGPSAVWQPAQSELSAIQHTCVPRGRAYSECFLKLMGDSGATEEAQSFSRNYAEQNRGVVAFLNGFRPEAVVDVGYGFFPSGADVTERWLLLNGTPGIIDVDNVALLPQAEMMNDPAYQALRQRYPHVTLFDGDRSLDGMPDAAALPDDGQSFTVDYPLKDRCRACAVVAQASFSFNFDADGKLLNVKFLKITPATSESGRP